MAECHDDTPPGAPRTAQAGGTAGIAADVVPPPREADVLSLAEACERAHVRTGVDDFDDDRVNEGLSALLEAIRTCHRIADFGHARLDRLVVEHLARRLRVERYLRDHPELEEAPIERPLFVMGMPRTGTTLTINLLDQDPGRRSVLKWELADPVPPPRGDALRTDPRCLAQLEEQRRVVAAGTPDVRHHFEWADQPTECVHVMSHDFKSMWWEGAAPMPEYSEFLFSCDMTSAYQWHRRLLQLLQSDAPGQWTLKGPSHVLWLPTLFDVYPDARVVWTHRDPFTALGSLCNLIANAHRRNCEEADLHRIREFYPWYMAEHVQRPMAVMDRYADRIHHVHYDELVRSPVETMERLHSELGDDFTEETRARMKDWVGQHHTSRSPGRRDDRRLEDVGLDRAGLAPLFNDYIDRFSIPLDR